MISKKDIQKLGQLARIGISEKESKELQKDLDAVLDFVSELKSASVSGAEQIEEDVLKNILREDKDAHEPGKYSEDLLKEAPKVEKGRVKVKKIL